MKINGESRFISAPAYGDFVDEFYLGKPHYLLKNHLEKSGRAHLVRKKGRMDFWIYVEDLKDKIPFFEGISRRKLKRLESLSVEEYYPFGKDLITFLDNKSYEILDNLEGLIEFSPKEISKILNEAGYNVDVPKISNYLRNHGRELKKKEFRGKYVFDESSFEKCGLSFERDSEGKVVLKKYDPFVYWRQVRVRALKRNVDANKLREFEIKRFGPGFNNACEGIQIFGIAKEKLYVRESKVEELIESWR